MGGKDANYQIVHRGEKLDVYHSGQWVFFQRPKPCGGGYWFGRTYDDCFWLEFERPTSLRAGLLYLMSLESLQSDRFDDDFRLEG
ncbi:hypothetical protein [Erwinia rhapontici]|uniref:hypothetical protein n=1 Tax=Erwinia rhapontici TaxID=55212 RepID=UPI001D5EC0DC|nr:hypothetical protein [Erwinia rhapontici]